MSLFKPATREKLKLRMALDGPSGSGKTYTALRFAFALAGPGGVAVIDTEHRSASKYQGEAPDGIPWNFQVCELESYEPNNYVLALREAASLRADVVIVDSLSHAWEGIGGALDQVDKARDKAGGNAFTAWKDVSPQHRAMVEAILASPCHVIATMRSKMEYILEEQVKPDGRKVMVPRKVGMQPIQRQGMEYEFDIVADLNIDNLLVVSKTRCSKVFGQQVPKPGPDFMVSVREWLDKGIRPAAWAPAATLCPASEPPGDGLYHPGQPGGVTPEQLQQIGVLAKQMNLDAMALKGLCNRKGKQSFREFSTAEADELIGRMQAKIKGTAPF